MSLIYEGRVSWLFPDNFDVDQIIGVQNIRETNLAVLAPLCMKMFDKDFAESAQEGDILVGGRNFGYGHPHFQSMAVMRRLGMWVVVAESFAPGFYRSQIVEGMVLLTVPGITQKVKRFECLSVNYAEGQATKLSTGEALQGVVPSPIVLELAELRSHEKYIIKKYREKVKPL